MALAQNTVTYRWIVGDTGNNDGIIEPDESAVLVMQGTMAPARTGFSGSIYDIRGVSNWNTGTVNSYQNQLDALTDDGHLEANNDITAIESFQLPPLFNPNFDPSNPVTLYRITWTPDDYSDRTVTVGDTNHLNNDVYTDTFGSSVPYTAVAGQISFEVSTGCPTDINRDGLINSQDVLAFLSLWVAKDERADWDGNGIVNTHDFTSFLNDWVAGC